MAKEKGVRIRAPEEVEIGIVKRVPVKIKEISLSHRVLLRMVEPLLVTHKLPGVDYILPGYVCSRSQRRYGVKVGKDKPYGKDSVLLSESLTSGNLVAEASSDYSPYFELD